MKSSIETRGETNPPIHFRGDFRAASLPVKRKSISNRSNQIFPTVQRYFAIGNLKSQRLNLRAHTHTYMYDLITYSGHS